jgi:hypothetical protein
MERNGCNAQSGSYTQHRDFIGAKEYDGICQVVAQRISEPYDQRFHLGGQIVQSFYHPYSLFDGLY